jgi:hypothetical protein
MRNNNSDELYAQHYDFFSKKKELPPSERGGFSSPQWEGEGEVEEGGGQAGLESSGEEESSEESSGISRLIPDMEDVGDLHDLNAGDSDSNAGEEGSSSIPSSLGEFMTQEEWNAYRERTGAQFVATVDPSVYKRGLKLAP